MTKNEWEIVLRLVTAIVNAKFAAMRDNPDRQSCANEAKNSLLQAKAIIAEMDE